MSNFLDVSDTEIVMESSFVIFATCYFWMIPIKMYESFWVTPIDEEVSYALPLPFLP